MSALLLRAWAWLSGRAAAIAGAFAALALAIWRVRRGGRMDERREQKLEAIEAEQRVRDRIRGNDKDLQQRHKKELDQISREAESGDRDHLDGDW